MPDFALAQVPNFAQAALSGYAAGRQIRAQRRTDEALDLFSRDPDAGAAAAERFDPDLGGKLRGIAMARQKQALLGAMLKGGGGSAPQALGSPTPQTGSIQEVAIPPSGEPMQAAPLPQSLPPTIRRPDGIEINTGMLNQLFTIDPELGMKMAEFAQKADKAQLEQAAAHGEIKAQAAAYLEGFPEGPARQQAFQRIAPQLVAAGFKPEDLAQARLDNESLKADKAFGLSFKDIVDQARDRWVQVGERGSFRVDSQGNPVGEGNPFATPTAQPSPGAAAPLTGAAIEQTALNAVPGAIVTSRQRSAAKNRAVGGVANSYHLTDQARDFVPPPGMSMGVLHSNLKAAFPGMDVINEGDHVHIEPSSRAKAATGPVRVSSKADVDRLPSGSLFVDPNGVTRRKP
jgi:hypothetical protein